MSGTESWRQVDGHPDYEVSNRGRVRSRRPGGGAMLSVAEADEIRRIYAEGRTTHAALGRRFGVARYTVSRIIRGETYAEPRILSPAISANFYPYVTLYADGKPPRPVYLHRLVAETWLDLDPTARKHVHHIDGDHENADVDNLEILDVYDHHRLHYDARELDEKGRFAA